jgi:hypothetical protein
MRLQVSIFGALLLILSGCGVHGQKRTASAPGAIEVLYFSADLVGSSRAPVVQLSWEVKPGVGSFKVLTSLDGIKWSTIGKVKQKQSQEEVVTYEFLDVDALQGVNYYRLQILDEKGKSATAFNTLINVKDRNALPMTAYPDQSNQEVHVVYYTPEPDTVRIQLYIPGGERIFDERHALKSGVNRFTYSTAAIKTKSFFVHTTNSAGRVMVNIVQQ